VFTARYALSPYIKQTRSVFKGSSEQLLANLKFGPWTIHQSGATVQCGPCPLAQSSPSPVDLGSFLTNLGRSSPCGLPPRVIQRFLGRPRFFLL
jgi:hypothetical protein